MLADHGLRAVLDVDAIRGSGLVGVDQVARIRSPPDRILEGAQVVGETAGLALAVTAANEEFVLARLVAEVGDPLAVGAPTGRSFRETRGAGEISRAPLFGGKRPEIATRRDHCALCIR